VALALEGGDPVHAGGSIETGLREAVVDVGLAALSFEAKCTLAAVSVDFVMASASVETGIARALVNIVFTEFARVAGNTAAAEASLSVVDTRGAVLAGSRGTGRQINLAGGPAVESTAVTHVAGLFVTEVALAPILAWLGIALVDRCFAEGSAEPDRTRAELGAVGQTRSTVPAGIELLANSCVTAAADGIVDVL
jgi:hypothetical protein